MIWRCVSLKPVNIGGHSAYQDRVLTQLRKYYPNAASLSSSTWQIIDKFWNLNLSQVDELMKDRYSVFSPEPRLPSDMLRAILVSASMGLISLNSLALAGDGTPVYTSAQERKTRTCNCLENGIRDCKYNRIYHQPDCDIGWDSFMS